MPTLHDTHFKRLTNRLAHLKVRLIITFTTSICPLLPKSVELVAVLSKNGIRPWSFNVALCCRVICRCQFRICSYEKFKIFMYSVTLVESIERASRKQFLKLPLDIGQSIGQILQSREIGGQVSDNLANSGNQLGNRVEELSKRPVTAQQHVRELHQRQSQSSDKGSKTALNVDSSQHFGNSSKTAKVLHPSHKSVDEDLGVQQKRVDGVVEVSGVPACNGIVRVGEEVDTVLGKGVKQVDEIDNIVPGPFLKSSRVEGFNEPLG